MAVTDLPICPGLFYGSRARDGILSRMRIPGGILNVTQCLAIADLVDRYSTGYLQVTNRANLQVRETDAAIPPSVWHDLQDLGLASHRVEIDPIRNIMSSPTAGIDRAQLIDTRPLVKAWDNYLQTHPELSELSPKFSVGFDGGESVSIGNLRNDILLSAETTANSTIAFRLFLNGTNTGITVELSQCIAALAALANTYLEYSKYRPIVNSKKPRLRHLLADWGVQNYLKRVEKQLPFLWCKSSIEPPHRAIEPYGHLGIHSQQQSGFSYTGITLPLGRLRSQQLRDLANLAKNFGSGSLRLTPRQNLLISDVPYHHLAELEKSIARLGLHSSATRPDSCLVACSGSSGCASAATDTQSHALKLAENLAAKLTLDRPINIHLTGCQKSCAQHKPVDITLMGIQLDRGNEIVEAYDIYAGSNDLPFGRQIFQGVTVAEMPGAIEKMLRLYQQHRDPNEQFGEFADRAILDFRF